ncbi:flavodoxin family protein [Cucumibacter marinus]|uniref:flavodoxin family protein n=1 Tax=Cucumibacter marinus TaxID=1121252 RepID=UPI00042279F0|nr:flavodoxin family protein [Cucumibacter marinus]
MSALVVYDSNYGNTERIAEAIATALSEAGHDARVEGLHGGQRPQIPSDVRLLVCGAPTNAFRASAAMNGYLRGLPPNILAGINIAAFDTRMDLSKAPWFLRIMANLFGFAAEKIARRLARLGGKPLGQPAGFVVTDMEGPLADGEIARAQAWARTLVAANS